MPGCIRIHTLQAAQLTNNIYIHFISASAPFESWDTSLSSTRRRKWLYCICYSRRSVLHSSLPSGTGCQSALSLHGVSTECGLWGLFTAHMAFTLNMRRRLDERSRVKCVWLIWGRNQLRKLMWKNIIIYNILPNLRLSSLYIHMWCHIQWDSN